MNKTNKKPKRTRNWVRNLLPVGYADTLANRTGLSASRCKQIVNNLLVNHPKWKDVLNLAHEEKQRRAQNTIQTNKLKLNQDKETFTSASKIHAIK